MMKHVIERALQAELTDHLGYESGVPRGLQGEYEPQLVPKGTRRLGQVDEMILSLYARGMTTRDITAHLAEVYRAEVPAALVPKETDVIVDEVASRQNRPWTSATRFSISSLSASRSDTTGTSSTRLPTWSSASMSTGIKNVLGVWL
nr:transposase [Streptomyces kronopolitis]